MPARLKALSRLVALCLSVVAPGGCGETTHQFGGCPGGATGPFGECLAGGDAEPADVAADDEGVPDVSGPDAPAPDVAFDSSDGSTEVDGDSGLTDDAARDTASTDPTDEAGDGTEPDASSGPCPAGMAPVGEICMDLYEAPNVAGALPLVMYSFYEAEDWCQMQGKRLCFDDEWTLACGGLEGLAYPYGSTREPGVCNDEEIWRTYSQDQLNGWPVDASEPNIGTLDALFERARSFGASGTTAANHVESLYQGEGSGSNEGCINAFGVYDLVGNVEEWTARRDGGEPNFSGNLKGRYWADTRTCQDNIRGHGNAFRFYEIGFRCCLDP